MEYKLRGDPLCFDNGSICMYCTRICHNFVFTSNSGNILCYVSAMITDVQLAAFANILGVTLFVLVVVYHYVAVNNPKRKEE